MKKNTGLGRGLEAIFETEKASLPPDSPIAQGLEELPLDKITPNPCQPRTQFDEDALEELADSIKTLGVIQPITVRRTDDDRYVIISGERRWRASHLAGMQTIPAYVRRVDEQNLHEMALVENIQRQDLNAMEIAISLQRLIDECDLTQDMLAARVSKKRSTVANYLRLLSLPAEVQMALRGEIISMGHAKAIAAAPAEKRLSALKRCIRKNLSVRQTEEMVKKLAESRKEADTQDDELPERYTRLVEHLEKFFSQNICIKKIGKGGGKIVIGFTDDEDIDRFLSKFDKVAE